MLQCPKCGKKHPIINGVPRFVSESNYANSFGIEWSTYGRVQIDSFSGNTISRDRFEATTGWRKNSKKGKLILDAGCGGGRFTEIALSTGATVVAFDYSNCVDFTKNNFIGKDASLHLAQADIYKMPFKNIFDGVFCMGVLQHTPEPWKTIQCLHGILKPAGELIIDVYLKSELEKNLKNLLKLHLNPQNWLWRPLLKRFPLKFLHSIIKSYVKCCLPIDTKILYHIKRGKRLNRLLAFLREIIHPIVIFNHSLQFPFLSDEYKLLWAQMNTFDQYSPKYTKPQSRESMRKWGEELKMDNIEVFIKPGCGDGTALVLKGNKRRVL